MERNTCLFGRQTWNSALPRLLYFLHFFSPEPSIHHLPLGFRLFSGKIPHSLFSFVFFSSISAFFFSFFFRIWWRHGCLMVWFGLFYLQGSHGSCHGNCDWISCWSLCSLELYWKIGNLRQWTWFCPLSFPIACPYSCKNVSLYYTYFAIFFFFYFEVDWFVAF